MKTHCIHYNNKSKDYCQSVYSFTSSEIFIDDWTKRRIVGAVMPQGSLNHRWKCDGILLESLHKLHLMVSSVQVLKEMELEKAIDSLQKHKSKLICDLPQNLINELSNMKGGWHESTDQFVDSEASHDAPVDEEWGLPCPPMDDGAFLMAPTSTMDLSKFFDGIDDNGNVRDNGELTDNLNQQKQPRGKGKEMRILKKVLQQTEPTHI